MNSEHIERVVKAELVNADSGYILNITTMIIPGVASCVSCNGTIPWQANISGYSGQVDVNYDGRKVLPSASGFCGTSSQGACQNQAQRELRPPGRVRSRESKMARVPSVV